MKLDLNAYNKYFLKLKHNSIIDLPIEQIPDVALFVFDRLTSTNTKLWSLIDSGVNCPTAAIALQQTAGKGQWGHSWVSQPGGLYLSVGLDLDLDVANYSHLVISTAWGIATVLRIHNLPVTIKWSNDLILDRHKLGGIKIETRNDKSKINQSCCGSRDKLVQNNVPKPGINLKSYYQNKNIESN